MSLSSQALYLDFFEALSSQHWEQAESLSKQLLTEHGSWAKSHGAAAALAIAQQNYAQAEQHVSRAVEREPKQGDYLFNWVQLLLKNGKKEQAKRVVESLLPEQIASKDADLCWLFARVILPFDFQKAFSWVQAAFNFYREAEGWPDFATQCYEMSADLLLTLIEGQVPSYKPTSAQRSVWVQMYVFLSLERQDFERPQPYLSEALKYNSELAMPIYAATSQLYETKKYKSSQVYFVACEPYLKELSVAPHAFYRAWALVELRLHNYDLAHRYYDKAIQYAPHPLTYAFEKISQFPAIYASETEIQVYRQQFAFQLNKLETQVNRYLEQKNMPKSVYIRYPFQLTYQGLNDKMLVSQLGRIAHRVFYGTDALHYTSYKPSQKLPLKIGFVSTYFFNHSVVKAYGKGIVNLAADEDVDVHVIHLGSTYDDTSAWMAAHVPHFIHEPQVPKAVERLKSLQLDVLIYTDIGMSTKVYFMAVQRLAPIQGVLGGHPVTTGIPHIDYFFRKERKNLKNDVEQYYSEKVVLLKQGIGKPNYYERPEHYTRDMFTAAMPSHHIYFCPMTLIKIHPTFDHALRGILMQDSQAQIYFVDMPDQPELSELLCQRFVSNLGSELAKRIFFIPWLDKTRFFEALCAADVVLDSFGFGSGTTTYQVLSMHQPIVTLPGELYRNTITFSYYQQFGMDEPVANSVEDYVAKAVRIATDKPYRQFLQAKVAECVAAYPEQRKSTAFKESLLYLAHNYEKIDPQQRVFRF